MIINEVSDPEELRRYAEDFEIMGQYIRYLRSAKMYRNTGGIPNLQAALDELKQAERIWDKQLPYWAKEILNKDI